MNIYYTYKHTIKETGEVFYIGRGKNKRAWDRNGRNSYWKRIVGRHEYVVEIIKDNMEIEESKKLEIDLIAQFKPRTNFTKGGDGTLGYVFDPDFVKERNQKNKDLYKDPKWVEKRNKSLTEAMSRPEVKVNVCEGLRKYHEKRIAEGKPAPWAGHKMSEEAKKAISESQKGEKGYWYGKITAMAKKVINLDTAEIFATIKTAAKSVNGTRVGLSRALKVGRKTYKKNKFRYHEE
jgi:hypothetical protein